MSIRLSALGCLSAALESLEEALRIQRQLGVDLPEIHEPDLYLFLEEVSYVYQLLDAKKRPWRLPRRQSSYADPSPESNRHLQFKSCLFTTHSIPASLRS